MAHKRGGKIGTRSYAGIFHATMEKWAQGFLLTEISQLRCWGGGGEVRDKVGQKCYSVVGEDGWHYGSRDCGRWRAVGRARTWQ